MAHALQNAYDVLNWPCIQISSLSPQLTNARCARGEELKGERTSLRGQRLLLDRLADAVSGTARHRQNAMKEGLPGGSLRIVTGSYPERRPASMLHVGLDLSRNRHGFNALDEGGASVEVGAAPPDAGGLRGLAASRTSRDSTRSGTGLLGPTARAAARWACRAARP